MSIRTWMCVVAMVTWSVASAACGEVTPGEQVTTIAQALSPTGPVQAIQLCGALKGSACSDATYCRQHDGVCGEIAIGWCAPITEICTDEYDPVCGCDGETYSNECGMMSAGVSLSAMGACDAGCSSDADCGSGVCDVLGCGDAAMPGVCVKAAKHCNREWAPVCGCDGETYPNDCRRLKAGVGLDHEGACATPCGGFAGLTCEEDEVCYYDAGTCEWADQMGMCEAPPEVCPKHIDPVCGCDGETYRNLCMMKRAEVSMDHEGVCCDPMLCLIGEAIDTDGDGCADLCPPPETCEEANPAGCKNTGCDDGEVCTYGLDCTPSICFCDGQSGAWMCTKDCGGGTCVPDEDPVDLCADFEEPNPQACTEGSCPEGSTCDLTTGCQASSCHCVVLEGEPHWNCTKDCVPGVCVSDAPSEGCCDVDKDCATGELCVHGGSDLGGVCKPTPPPAFPAVTCWSAAGCPGEETCDGGTVCPCGAQCFAPDAWGICSGSSDGPGEPDSPEEFE